MTLSAVVQQWSHLRPDQAPTSPPITIAGRIVYVKREAGGLLFWMLCDDTAEVQAIVSRTRLADRFDDAAQVPIDTSVEVVGQIVRSSRGTLSVLAQEAAVLLGPQEASS